MKIAIVTGASSGLGKEFVKLIDHSMSTLDEIWVIARREGRLVELAEQSKTRLIPIEMDLSSENQLNLFKRLIEQKKPSVKLLINCAGFGKIGSNEDISYQDETDMVKVNCLALTAITYAVLPYMCRNSRIIQLASSAAFLPQPYFSVYAATKAYVLSFSRSLNQELRKREIYVTAVCPGPVRTEFFDIAEKTGNKIAIYKTLVMAEADQVVKQAYYDAINRKAVSVYGIWMKLFRILCKLIPHEWLLPFFVKVKSHS